MYPVRENINFKIWDEISSKVPAATISSGTGDVITNIANMAISIGEIA